MNRTTCTGLLCLFLLNAGLQSCGIMSVKTKRYFSVTNGDTKNYYRLRIKGKSVLGDASYKNGWFPQESVDMLFGNVSDSVESEYQKTTQAIQKKVNSAVIATYKNWLDVAQQTNVSTTELDKLLEARKRILAYPYGVPYPNTSEIEYNPAKGIAILHSDDKEVFILSSNPDDIIGKIANFSETKETVKTINQLSEIIYNQKAQEQKDKILRISRDDTLIKEQLDRILARYDTMGAVWDTRGKVEMDVLVKLLNE
jgi:uncharacterized protein YdbL (DUF1318 family)